MTAMRVLSSNLADSSTTTASTTAGAYVAANLALDTKSLVWRATGLSATLSCVWGSTQNINCVILPFNNFTPAATIRVQGYSDSAGTILVVDTGTIPANPAPATILNGFTLLASQSAYAYGGGSYAMAYFALTGVQKIVVTLNDSANTAGYLEVSRLLAGAYWSPAYNADMGASLTLQDTSKNVRSEGGDLITALGTFNRKLGFTLSKMSPADRAALTIIFRSNGFRSPMFISMFPQNTDSQLEDDHQIYGKLTAMSAMTIPVYSAYSAPLEIEEV
ncbi:hypothetical protein [Solimicrobium silvestre]|uniref:Uncharacterized protein n=1 Tax=Solimicrobium silvestre TaxID=2099400 RepID=A0A2S9GY88_9BURK|nr:hypothetical protein [Solimicrobium silvestre]PRC92684.1 hypothetical protein S2091_2739 [Solimicrobium silvestre]